VPDPFGRAKGLGTFTTSISGGTGGVYVPPPPPPLGAMSLFVIVQVWISPNARVIVPSAAQSPPITDV